MKQEFFKDDLAMLDQFPVYVVDSFQDDDTGEWYCEVKPIEFKTVSRVVKQDKLKRM